ncbi:hypothetical protein V6N13_050736 [Hibiscus sabdariffa]
MSYTSFRLGLSLRWKVNSIEKKPRNQSSIYCKVSWKLWLRCCELWNIHLVMPYDLRSFLTIWVNCPIRAGSFPVWLVAFHGMTMAWTIWLFRNEVVFDDKKVDDSQMFDIFITRVAWWCKCNWADQVVSISHCISCPSMISIGPSCSKLSLKWQAPGPGCLKFNVDGAVVGSFEDAGIGVGSL